MAPEVIALVCTVLTCITALTVGYLHRKQMRQVEAFRVDPKVSLTPPESAFLRVLKDRWYYVLWLFLGYLLIREAIATEPLTRMAVFSMVINGATLALCISLEVFLGG